MTTANKITTQCEWIKIIPILWSDRQKLHFLMCYRIFFTYFFKILICYCYSITVVCLFSPFPHPQNFFLKILFYFRGEGREKERERNINVWFLSLGPPLGTWPEIQACALTGNRTSDLLAHSSCSIHWAISPSAAEF